MPLSIPSLNALKQLADKLAESLKPGDVVALTGTLGAGKTTFCQFCINALCNKEANVTSPTFNIMQLYDAANYTVVHADLYRIESSMEIEELGLEEYFDNSVTFIEWPEKAKEFLPKKSTLFLEINIANDDMREITASGNPELVEACNATTV